MTVNIEICTKVKAVRILAIKRVFLNGAVCLITRWVEMKVEMKVVSVHHQHHI